MPRRFWLPAGLVLALTVPVLAAEEPSAPPDAPPSSSASSDREVTLVERHAAGQRSRAILGVRSQFILTPEGQPGLRPMPLRQAIEEVINFRTEHASGSRLVVVGAPERLAASTNSPKYATSASFRNGRWTCRKDGKTVAFNSRFPEFASLRALARPHRTSVRTQEGEARFDRESTAAGEFMVAGAAATLPDHPVRVGDGWSVRSRVPAAVPGAMSSAGWAIAEYHYSLKSLGTSHGHTIALIEWFGETTPGATAAGQSLHQSYTGTARFDVDRGDFLSLCAITNLDMSAPAAQFVPAGRLGPNAPSGVRITGKLVITGRELSHAGGAPSVRARPAAPAPENASGERRTAQAH